MVEFKYVLFYSERSKRYRLSKVKVDGFNPNNPNVYWIFDEEKVKIAKRVATNLNIALETSKFRILNVRNEVSSSNEDMEPFGLAS